MVACREVAAQAKALALTRSAAVNERLLQIVCVDAMQYGCTVNSCAVGRPAARAYRNLALLPSEIAFLTKAALFHAHVAAPLQPHPSLLGAAAHAAVRSLLPEPAELRVVPTVAPACAGGGGTEAEAAVTAVVFNGRIVSEYLHEPFEAETWAIVRQTLASAHAPAPESAPPPPCAACAAAALTPDANFCSICGERVRRATAPAAAVAVTVTAATAGVAAAAAAAAVTAGMAAAGVTAAAAAGAAAGATAAATAAAGTRGASLPAPFDLLRLSEDLRAEELGRTEVRPRACLRSREGLERPGRSVACSDVGCVCVCACACVCVCVCVCVSVCACSCERRGGY